MIPIDGNKDRIDESPRNADILLRFVGDADRVAGWLVVGEMLKKAYGEDRG